MQVLSFFKYEAYYALQTVFQKNYAGVGFEGQARLVKWYNRRLQNVGRGVDSLISRSEVYPANRGVASQCKHINNRK